MTEEQKKKVQELRIEGLGYQAIANLLGIDRDSVRYFCRTNNLAGKKSDKKTRISKKGVFCLYCNSPIVQTPGKRERYFCSDKCRISWWNNKRKNTTCHVKGQIRTKCRYCGKPFYSYRSQNKKYCSISCYMSDRFKGEKTDGQKAV